MPIKLKEYGTLQCALETMSVVYCSMRLKLIEFGVMRCVFEK